MRRAKSARTLCTLFVIFGGIVLFTVDAAGQPTQTKLPQSLPPSPYGMGQSVAIETDTALVSGSSLILAYQKIAGEWQFVQSITPPYSNQFGYGRRIDVENGIAIVGAYNALDPDNCCNQRGAAFVYEWNNNSWSYTEEFRISSTQDHSEFGHSVAISGNRIVVGAPRSTQVPNRGGAIYIYEQSGIGWEEVQVISGSGSTSTSHRFGDEVAIDGDTIVVSCPEESHGGRRGYIYVFEKQDGAFVETAKITSLDKPATLGFKSLAISGDTIVAGAARRDSGSTSFSEGIVVTFERDSGAWTQDTILIPDPPFWYQGYGLAIDIEGSAICVGAPGVQSGITPYGEIYTFYRTDGIWRYQTKLTADDGMPFDAFGISVAIDGTSVLTGAIGVRFSLVNTAKIGASYLFDNAVGPDDDSDGVPNFFDECPNTPSFLAVDGDGTPLRDINGDCDVDVEDLDQIVTAILNQTSTNQLPYTHIVVPGGQHNSELIDMATDGQTIAFTSSYSDGAIRRINIVENTGGAWTVVQTIFPPDPVNHGWFGEAIAIDGELMAIGALEAIENGIQSGAVYLYQRVAGEWTYRQTLTPDVPISGEEFGDSVSIDGSTIAVGAPRRGQNFRGAIFLFENSENENWEIDTILDGTAYAGVLGEQVRIKNDVLVALGRSALLESTEVRQYLGTYVFERNAGVWGIPQELSTELYNSNERAASLDFDGTTIVVGIPNSEFLVEGQGYVGALAFSKLSSQWELQSTLPGAGPSNFGNDVGVSGDRIIVAIRSDYNGVNGSGSTYMFNLESDQWRHFGKIAPQTEFETTYWFNDCIAIGGDIAVIGSGVDLPESGMYIVDLANIDDNDGVSFDEDHCRISNPGNDVDNHGRSVLDANHDCRVDGQDLQIIINELLGT